MPLEQGLVAHTLHEARDLNDYQDVFDGIPASKPDAEMVQLAKQLIGRQAGRYDSGDIEDRYETRLRALIDAKVKGEGLSMDEEEPEERGNVVDIMAALRKSLGQVEPEDKPAKRTKSAKPAAAKAPKPAAKQPQAKPATRRRA